jgi:hypothetical protein
MLSAHTSFRFASPVARSLFVKIESLADNVTVEILPEFKIARVRAESITASVLLRVITRPLFADRESVVKVPLLVSVVLFSVLMRPLLA